MPTLTDLPGELISWIGEYLEASDVGSIRLASKDLCKKMSYRFSFLFKTVKVSLIKVSIQALSDATSSPDIAKRVEHLIVGTEHLLEYVHECLNSSRVHPHVRDAFGLHRVTKMQLQTLIFERLVNLRKITIEDRPALHHSPQYRSIIGNSELIRVTGIDLRSNGPYEFGLYSPPREEYTWGRTSVHRHISDILAYLAKHGRHLDLEIILRGCKVKNSVLVPGEMPHVLSLVSPCIRQPLDDHLTHLTIGEEGFNYNTASRYRQQWQDLRDYALGKGIPLVEWGADGMLR